MVKTILLMLALIAAPSALAQRVAEPDVIPSQKEIRAFEKTKISLAQAINIAAQKHKDARVVDVSFDGQSDQLAYKVKTYQDKEIWEGALDAWTGEMLGDGTTTPVSKLDDEDKLELAGLLKASIDLAKATAIAEEKALGKAISAGLEETNGEVVYEITVVKDGSMTKYTVDPKSGKIR
ncbi:putative membrane protein YkoI [Bradyrhizobium sp. LB7.2]